MSKNILLIEDNEATRFGFIRYFTREGFIVCEAEDLAVAAAAMSRQRFNAIILDINLPDGNGLEFIKQVRSNDQNIPIIVITGSGSIPLAVEAMQLGADNFLTKPVDNAGLALFLRKILDTGTTGRRSRQHQDSGEDIFFGESAAIDEIVQISETASRCDSPVLITGETGTGKGVLARWIHRKGRRGSKEFVELNCSGLRGEMLSREIFGNVKGAFTSADQDRQGLLDVAHNGTLFLDEIGDMGSEIQAQFLKVLEEKTYRRLGDVRQLRSDFRLICATNRELEGMVKAGTFRQDLMYRINLITIRIPPLRERQEDIPALAQHLLRSLGSSEPICPEVLKLLSSYSWPGNIRELKNVLERALLLTPAGAQLRPEQFSRLASNQITPSRTVQEVEEKHITSVLKEVAGDINKAAKSLNISRATLYRRLKCMKERLEYQPVSE